MADTINHFRLVLRGNYVAAATELADEEWSTGVSLYAQLSSVPDIGTPDGSFEAADALLSDTDANGTYEANFSAEGGETDLNPMEYMRDQVRPAVAAFMNTASAAHFMNTRLLIATLYPMKTVNGVSRVCSTSYGPAKAVFTPIGTPPSGPTGNNLPTQNATVVSLRTGNATRKGRGRMYIPGVGSSAVSQYGTVGSTARTALAGGAATFMSALEFTQGIGPALQIIPVVIGPAGTKFFKITRCSVGTIVDSQRRRRAQLPEVYTNADVTY